MDRFSAFWLRSSVDPDMVALNFFQSFEILTPRDTDTHHLALTKGYYGHSLGKHIKGMSHPLLP